MIKRTAIAALSLPLLLAACGIKGGLARPAPLFGEERARYEAEQKRQKEAAAAAAPEAAPAGAQTTPTPPPPSRPSTASPISAPPLP